MGVTYQKVAVTTMLGLAVLLLSWSYAVGAEQAQAEQKSSDQLLTEIVDLHSRLVTNDVFLAQAKMLGAYLQSAQPMEESKKAAIYRSVLGMLERIKESSAQVSPTPTQEKAKPEQKPKEGVQGDKPVYVPGVALLEIFKTNSMDNLPAVPITRAHWKRDLACGGSYPLPDQINAIGERSEYVARFSFYYEAKQPGAYAFIVTHVEGRNNFRLTVGNVVIARHEGSLMYFGPRLKRDGDVIQGIANLEKGFHKVEFLLLSCATRGADGEGLLTPSGNAYFAVKVHPPDLFNAVPLTKDMILLRADQMKAPPEGQQKGTSGQAIPYVDY